MVGFATVFYIVSGDVVEVESFFFKIFLLTFIWLTFWIMISFRMMWFLCRMASTKRVALLVAIFVS